MKKIFWQKTSIGALMLVFCLSIIMPKFVSAATTGGVCGSGTIKLGCQVGTAQAIPGTDDTAWFCIENNIYSSQCNYINSSASSTPTDLPIEANFGSIEPDLGDYGEIQSGENGLAEPIKFANNIIAFSTTVIGIWFLINIILQGIKIINNAKDPKAFNESVQKIIWSIAGIALVALAYVIAGWVSAQLFGDTTTILNPSI